MEADGGSWGLVGERVARQYAGLGADLKACVTSKENPSIRPSESPLQHTQPRMCSCVLMREEISGDGFETYYNIPFYVMSFRIVYAYLIGYVLSCEI